MIVMKFGGTSLGTPQRMQEVARLIDDGQEKIVVLSAVAGTTNKLENIGRQLRQGRVESAFRLLGALREEYDQFVKILFPTTSLPAAREILEHQFGVAGQIARQAYQSQQEKALLAQGELLSTRLFTQYLRGEGVDAVLLPALDFMRIGPEGEPNAPAIAHLLASALEDAPQAPYYITQGYICRNPFGAIDNLRRGGSDYTATLIGAGIGAREIQIWTDIDGLHNNDPRVVSQTFSVRQLSYREAAELAYFGAKILHPTCVLPAEKQGVPIRLKNTFAPEAPGTLISGRASGNAISAIAAKDGITALKIRSHRMLMAYGFLRKVFQVFEDHRTPIDMITTSEVAVSLTIDDTAQLDEIVEALSAYGEVSFQSGQTIICIVGDALNDQRGRAKEIFEALEPVPVRMVSYGGSDNNVSVLVSTDYKAQALKALNERLFALTG